MARIFAPFPRRKSQRGKLWKILIAWRTGSLDRCRSPHANRHPTHGQLNSCMFKTLIRPLTVDSVAVSKPTHREFKLMHLMHFRRCYICEENNFLTIPRIWRWGWWTRDKRSRCEKSKAFSTSTEEDLNWKRNSGHKSRSFQISIRYSWYASGHNLPS
jgi:hypothetical protein